MRPLATLVVLLVSATGVQAQRPRAGGAPPALAAQGTPDSAGRARLEGDIRRGLARAVRKGVGLSDEQMTRLIPVTQRYEQQRRQLQMDERNARLALRASIRAQQPADDGQVDRHLQTLVDVQKRRAQLLESEQRDLATFMTPLQRARYMAIQEQLRRRLEQMRQRRMQLFEGEVPPGPQPRQRPPL